MRVFGDDIVSVSGDGAIHKFVVIFIYISQQAKTIIGFTVMGHWVARDSLHHIVRNLGRGVYSKYLFVLRQYLIAHAQAVLPAKKVRPNPMVRTFRGQCLNQCVGVKNHVAHRSEGLVWSTEVLAAQFVQLGLIKCAVLPHLVDGFLSLFGEKEGNGKLQRIQILLRVDVGGRVHQFQLGQLRKCHFAVHSAYTILCCKNTTFFFHHFQNWLMHLRSHPLTSVIINFSSLLNTDTPDLKSVKKSFGGCCTSLCLEA